MVYKHARKIMFSGGLTQAEVLLKKSPVEKPEPELPDYLNGETELWVIPQTGEAFWNYDDYLRKLDYYKQKVFTCEITGHSHLTYFDAKKSEDNGAAALETSFPKELRKPVLEKVQFQQISRLDNLVTWLYDFFHKNIQVSESVLVEVDQSGHRQPGKVKERSINPRPAGEPLHRYFVELENGQGIAMVDDEHIFRPPRIFTKQILRNYLRHAIEREAFDNAPWTIKDEVARQYGIDNALPRHLTQPAVQAWRKVKVSLEKSNVNLDRVIPRRAADFDEMTQTIIEHKGKMPTDLVMRYAQAYKAIRDPSSVPAHQPHSATLKAPIKTTETSSATPAPPEIKYPREDFEVKSKPDANQKPTFHYHQEDTLSTTSESSSETFENMTHESIGKALSIWSTLNIHSRHFVLDGFTYDNFLDAMLYTSEELPCELFEEVHCAVLKSLVNKEGEAEAMIPSLSDLTLSSDSSPDESASSSPMRGGSVAGEQARPNQGSRDSTPLSEIDQSRLNGDTANGGVPLHNAKAMLESYDWMTRIKDRAFEYGGWQVALIGLLFHLSQTSWLDDAPERILRAVAPTHEPATKDTARRRYADLDINLRLAALECAVMLACTSKSFKDSMEARAAQQTTDRKDKTDAQRRRKPLIDELTKLDTERKMTRPDDYDEPMTNGRVDPDEMEVDGSEAEVKQDSEEDDSDSDVMRGRRRSGRASDLKRKHEQLEREKEAKFAEAKQAAQSKEHAAYEQILMNIDAKRAEIKACEKEIEVVDGKLRENSCHRTRCLGVDRYCNRYWWFERNGMPFTGHEESSTADHGYMNGRLWVQGPGALEREGFFEGLSSSDAGTFKEMGGATPTERRDSQPHATVLTTDTEWAYYSTPDELKALMSWLDDRGDRERKLLKELGKWKSSIIMTMQARADYLDELAKRREEAEEDPIGVATRKKLHSEKDKLKHPCLSWTNGEAVRQIGGLHSDGQGKAKMRGVVRPKGHVGFVAVNQMLPGKRETRRGTKY